MLSPEESYKLFQKMGLRVRGFEFISEEQWESDCPETYKPIYPNEEQLDIVLPKRSTSSSAGYDFFSPFKFTLLPGESIKIPTGIKAYMMMDEVLHIYPRSSLGFKYFLRPANLVPVIDSDYYNNPDNEGHIWIKLRNEGDTIVEIEKGSAFCQGIFQKYLLVDGDDFEGKERIGGIGSTDRNK